MSDHPFLLDLDLADEAGKTIEESEERAAKMLRERGGTAVARVTSPSEDPDNPPVLLSVITLHADGSATATRTDGTTREL
jgi:hypothetical protein